MKAIRTRWSLNSNGNSVYSATDCDGNSCRVSYDPSRPREVQHMRAAQELCRRLGWHGTMVGGHLPKLHEVVWVWVQGTDIKADDMFTI